MQCSICQLVKSKRHTKAPFVSYPIAKEALSEINVDLIGPLLESRGLQYILTICDRFIKAVSRLHFRIQKVTQLSYTFKSLCWNLRCAKSAYHRQFSIFYKLFLD